MSTIVTISIKLFPIHLARCYMSNISLDHPFHPIYLWRQNEYIGSLIFPKGTRKLREVNDLPKFIRLLTCVIGMPLNLSLLVERHLLALWDSYLKSLETGRLGQSWDKPSQWMSRWTSLGLTWALRALPSALHSHFFQLAFLLRPVCTGMVLCCLSLLLTQLLPALLEIDTHGKCLDM